MSQVSTSKKDSLLALARLYHLLGRTLYGKEDYDQALEVIKKSHELDLRFLLDDASQLLPICNNMSSIYLRQGKVYLTLQYHNKTLEIELASLPENHPTVAVTYHNRATVLEGLGKLEQAVESAKKLLNIY